MPRVARQSAAKLGQILEYMDGPQAVLLERSADNKIVAVAIDREGCDNPFFDAAISYDQWERYRRGVLDLRFLFMYPRWKEWYTFDLKSGKADSIRLTRVPRDSFAESNYIPESGFFSYDHSEPVLATETYGLATQKYVTDGIWDLPDFTEFYHKINDIYVFFLSLKKYTIADKPLDEKKRIREAFMGHPLRGGSSYVNLYTDLMSAQELNDRLSVGEVDVRGRLDIFAEMRDALDELQKSYDALKQSYKYIYGYLAKNKMLRIDSENFNHIGAGGEFLLQEGLRFATEIDLSNEAHTVNELTGQNPLKFIKVLLSYFRRLERYFMLFAEGRVASDEIIAPSQSEQDT